MIKWLKILRNRPPNDLNAGINTKNTRTYVYLYSTPPQTSKYLPIYRHVLIDDLCKVPAIPSLGVTRCLEPFHQSSDVNTSRDPRSRVAIDVHSDYTAKEGICARQPAAHIVTYTSTTFHFSFQPANQTVNQLAHERANHQAN